MLATRTSKFTGVVSNIPIQTITMSEWNRLYIPGYTVNPFFVSIKDPFSLNCFHHYSIVHWTISLQSKLQLLQPTSSPAPFSHITEKFIMSSSCK